jgi:hypothetical protein
MYSMQKSHEKTHEASGDKSLKERAFELQALDLKQKEESILKVR